jgi:galactose mutarotase-like enzyme
MNLREDVIDGFRCLTVENEELELSVVPELGGKLRALRFRGHPHNAFLEPPDFPYRRAWPGAPFEAFDTSGFDECFPTVAASAHPDLPETALPDHGELWTAEWSCEPDAGALRMEPRLAPGRPWRFTRRLTLSGRTLRLEYEVASQAERAVRYLWSAHPLLAASTNSRIYLPAEVRSLLIEYSYGDRLGARGDQIIWPVPELEVLRGRDAGWAEKLFTERLIEGTCAFHDAASDVSVRFRFDPRATPYLGLWICQGGWPAARLGRHLTVALEPCSGRPDALGDAARRGECAQLAPGETHRWVLELELGLGPPTTDARGIVIGR